jgi:hypothetical protein
MRTRAVALFLCPALCLAACRSSPPPAASGPVDVPISVGFTGQGALRFSVPIQVGSAPPLQAILDTGSAGLILLPGAVPDAALSQVTSTTAEIAYGAPERLLLSGVVALADVTVGSLGTAAPIGVLQVDTAVCPPSDSGCSVSATLSDLFGPFQALLGVGMDAETAVGNPIVQMPGSPAYVIDAPTFGGTSGTLRIQPTAADVASFQTLELMPETTTLPNGVGTYDDHAVPACITDQSSGVPYCAGAVLDTGTPDDEVNWAPYSPEIFPGGVLAPGSDVAVTVGTGLASFSFVVGPDPQPGLDKVTIAAAGTGTSQVLLGTPLFFHYDVFEDQAHGVIGFAPQPTADGGADFYDAGEAGEGGLATCWPTTTSHYDPATYVTATAHQRACSAAAVTAFVAACGLNGSGNACTSWATANLASSSGDGTTCGNCIVAPMNDGAVWVGSNGIFGPNYAACVQVTDPAHGPACAAAFDDQLGCGAAACPACGATNVAACEASADLGVCGAYEAKAESACAPEVGNGGAFDACSPGGSTGVDQDLTYIATLICGT